MQYLTLPDLMERRDQCLLGLLLLSTSAPPFFVILLSYRVLRTYIPDLSSGLLSAKLASTTWP